MRFGLQLAPLEELPLAESCRFAAECAHLSSRYPFDVIVAPQHYRTFPVSYPHATTLLASLLGETGATLATGVLALPLLPAVEVAESAYTLSALSGGRYVLGVGLGYRPAEFESFGVPYAGRAAVFEENLQTVYETWSQHAASAAWAGADPARPPVWIGASAARGIRRAAAMADAWLAPPLTPPGQLTRDLATYRGACASARRPPARQLPIRRDMLICGPREEDRRLAERYVSRRFATYASWGLPGPAGGSRPAGEAAGPAVGPPAVSPPAQSPPDRGGPAQVVGTAAECRAQLSALQRAVGGPALVIVRVAWPGMTQPEVLGQIRLAGEELIPAMIKECGDE